MWTSACIAQRVCVTRRTGSTGGNSSPSSPAGVALDYIASDGLGRLPPPSSQLTRPEPRDPNAMRQHTPRRVVRRYRRSLRETRCPERTAPAAPCPLGLPRLRDRSTRVLRDTILRSSLSLVRQGLGRGHSTKAVDPVCGTGVDGSCCSVTAAAAVAEFHSCGPRTIAGRPAPRDRPRALNGFRATTGPGTTPASRAADRR
jgi:hypothetical protein